LDLHASPSSVSLRDTLTMECAIARLIRPNGS
jgi:hypothetical protein